MVLAVCMEEQQSFKFGPYITSIALKPKAYNVIT